ncbi:MAG: aminopeptidase N [Desulfuromonadales bacterium]|nr:aminopeptidase N [Desulfuromonadales bacterium]
MSQKLTTHYLKDYSPPTHLVDQLELRIDLHPTRTKVHAVLQMRSNPACVGDGDSLRLDGRQLDLVEVVLDGKPLDPADFNQDKEGLTIDRVPEEFSLATTVLIDPEGNEALEGLYRSSGIFCTQCEAQGFRKITFYPDRPDVMARFTVTLSADRTSCQVLLSNGNCVASGELEDGRHYATFVDPFPKPSYLFAMVAGDLVAIEDTFTTCSGRKVALQIFVEERNRSKCEHAMQSLKKSMTWDEKTFGLEYDLDEYKIVAVDDFNMGAMENKGLNVFNSKYVLAKPDTATDADFQAIEGVIGHEYFHNWTGNRITCRDWFQLSLKEGLTVFRDQEFSSDMGSRPVKRINEVRMLRNAQFPEDAGPMAHPVRPDSYVEINNFYTATVYNKGAEVIRMYQTLLGRDAFIKGVKLYLERFDGQAVTTDDFLETMAEAGGIDLAQFGRWYSQSGTPLLEVSGEYDAAAQTYRLKVRQEGPDTPGQAGKQPFLIPLAVGLLGPDGADLPLLLAREDGPSRETLVLPVKDWEQEFLIEGVAQPPVPSLLRDFSAPVQLRFDYSDADLAFLFAHDSDAFNRWEAGQRLARKLLLSLVDDIQAGREPEIPGLFLNAFRKALSDRNADPALLSLALTLPSEIELAEAMSVADPGAIHAARESLRYNLATVLEPELDAVMQLMRDPGLFDISPGAIGRRSLKNLCMAYLSLLRSEKIVDDCFRQFTDADNMTDCLTALTCLVHGKLPRWEESLVAFYHQYQDDPLVVDKWFALQATAPGDETLDHVSHLMEHPTFSLKNPNRMRALVSAFAHANPACFHVASGAGYRFVADQVIALDAFNPQVAARLVGTLIRWRRYDEERQQLMREQLERIRLRDGLSRDVGEIVGKSLDQC